ncbi:MAG: hypothetical protein ACR2G5_10380, partial [Pyrinomonadaceae bacterium]
GYKLGAQHGRRGVTRYTRESFTGCFVPYPGGSKDALPFLPFGLRPYPEFTAGRRLAMFHAATSARGRISGLQTFPYVEASSFACHPGRSHRYGELQVLPLFSP